MRLVVGLGNPGKEYTNTRHNVGIMCLQTLAKHFKVQLKSSCGGLLAEVESQKIILFQPLSQMNVSGPAIKKVMKKYAIESNQLIVLHDNLEADMGIVK
jgi:PTH1 family peptidyl-tRNA hydrolase